MENTALTVGPRGTRSLTRRDLLRPVFRHVKAGLAWFVVLAVLALLAAVAWPAQYRAEMKILVKRDRVEPLMTAGASSPPPVRQDVSDEDIYSEVALLTSRDLLEDVATAAGLVPKGSSSDQEAKARAVQGLEKQLSVTPIRKTALIEVAYVSRDPQQAGRVLNDLSRLYLEKHLAVHRSPNAHDFFNQQAQRLRDELQAAEAKLVAFGQSRQVVSASSERDSALQKLAEFQGTYEQLRASIADADRRLIALQQQVATTPARLVTLQRRQDNGELVSQMTSKVLDLEIKRTEMLRKFNPKYPPVVELEQQLAQARQALGSAQQAPIKDESTDQNPTFQWLGNEAAKVQAERQALQARLASTQTTIRDYQQRARVLDEEGSHQRDLERVVKTAEENYLLYQRKAEETRISEALDQSRIANVTLAEAPRVPSLPTLSRTKILAAGLALALLFSLAAAFLLEYLDPRFRTRTEVEAVLELPVLAAIPAGATR